MEEIIFSLKHYWRFVDLEVLELQALSWGSGSVRTKNGGKGKTMATHRGKEALLQ
jgi:hypothetical protein